MDVGDPQIQLCRSLSLLLKSSVGLGEEADLHSHDAVSLTLPPPPVSSHFDINSFNELHSVLSAEGMCAFPRRHWKKTGIDIFFLLTYKLAANICNGPYI